MVLSKRERYIAIGLGVVVAALAFDRLILTGLLDSLAKADQDKKTLSARLNRNNATLKRSQELGPRWQALLQTSMKNDPAAAENQVMVAIRDWARESGVAMSLYKPDRVADKTVLPEIAFQATGTGTMESIRRLLWRIEQATIPIRIAELTVTPQKEGVDSLSVTLRLTTVYTPGGVRPATQPATATSSTRGVGR